jgi:SAM-dependent methyltransferase
MIHRAVGLVIERLRLEPTISVYEMSARGALVRFLKRRFPPGAFSEYYADVTPGHYKGRIRCEDVQRLTYEDESFDLVTSTEVFEHVPDDLRGFHEVYRVLRPGGHFVFSVPLRDGPTTLERAFVIDGRIVHVLPPAYHNDRIRGRRRVLAFRTYGRDITNKLQGVGFEANIHLVREPHYGIAEATVLTGRKGMRRRP